MIAPVFAVLTLAAGAFAQTASPVDLAAAKANFDQSHIVPDLLSAFDPSAVLAASFSGNSAAIGQPLTIDQVKEQPELTVNPAAAADAFAQGNVFTVAMVDPGVVGADQSAGQTRHWLVNNVALSGEGPYTLNYTTEAITAYGGPYPAEGSGPHRYTILLLPQPSSFKAPDGLNAPGVAISTMNFPEYINSTGLGAPVAGFYFTVEQGTSTVSVESTSAVVTSTLAVSASAAGSASAAASSASASGSAAAASVTKTKASASAAASAAASSAAPASAGSRSTTVGGFAVVGAAGLVAAALF